MRSAAVRYLTEVLCVLVVSACAQGAATYTVTDISPGGYFRINDNGQVVGDMMGGSTASLWEGGIVTDLGGLPGYAWCAAEGLSLSGQYMAGYVLNVDYGDGVGLLWDNGVKSQLNPLPGDAGCIVLNVNDSGRVAGCSSTTGTSDDQHPAYWQDGIAYALPTLGGEYGSALDINNSGVMVGDSMRADGRDVPCMWIDGWAIDLGILSGYNSGWSRAINESGNAAINFSSPQPGMPRYTAALWDEGVITPIHAIGTRPSTYSYDVNELDQVVGMLCVNSSTDLHAMLWDDGVTYDLNALIPADSGWELQVARSINDRGWIVGQGTYNGETRRFLLTPVVPAPGAIFLGMIGVAAAGLMKRLAGPRV